MGTPTMDDFNAMICMKIIKKHLVTMDDVNLSTKYYSPGVRGIKGRTRRSMPTPVVSNIVEIPK